MVVRSPCQGNYPADAHPSALKSMLESANPSHGLGVCIWMHLVNGTGNGPSPGRPTPEVVKQDKSPRGSPGGLGGPPGEGGSGDERTSAPKDVSDDVLVSFGSGYLNEPTSQSAPGLLSQRKAPYSNATEELIDVTSLLCSLGPCRV